MPDSVLLNITRLCLYCGKTGAGGDRLVTLQIRGGAWKGGDVPLEPRQWGLIDDMYGWL